MTDRPGNGPPGSKYYPPRPGPLPPGPLSPGPLPPGPTPPGPPRPRAPHAPEAGRSTPEERETLIRTPWILIGLLLTACGSTPEPPPEVGVPVGYVPDLRQYRVMVLPVQSSPGVRGSLDEELAYALRDRAGGIDWIFPDVVRDALRRSPALRADIDALPVDVFLQREVLRIGDPLYGEIRRAAALVDANLVLLPVQVRFRAEAEERPAAVETVTALIDVRSGRIVWFAILEGEPGTGDDPGSVASAMESLALALTGG